VAADLAAAQTLELAMRKLQADPEIDLPTFDGSAQFTNEQALITLKNRIVEQQARIAQLSETLREDSPEVVGAHQTLENAAGAAQEGSRRSPAHGGFARGAAPGPCGCRREAAGGRPVATRAGAERSQEDGRDRRRRHRAASASQGSQRFASIRP
jgi:hypothetical protein